MSHNVVGVGAQLRNRSLGAVDQVHRACTQYVTPGGTTFGVEQVRQRGSNA